jgi:hypothetical protein
MKQYYRLTQALENGNAFDNEPDLPPDPEGYTSTFLDGRKIVVPVPNPLEINLAHLKKNENPSHFICNSAHFLIISDLLLTAFKDSGITNFQIFPVVLKDTKTKREWNNYYAFNELDCIDAALLEKCEYDVLVEGDKKLRIIPLYSFDEVVLSAKKLKKEPKMFRIIHDPGEQLYISEDVVDVLRANSPPEKWGLFIKKTEVK